MRRSAWIGVAAAVLGLAAGPALAQQRGPTLLFPGLTEPEPGGERPAPGDPGGAPARPAAPGPDLRDPAATRTVPGVEPPVPLRVEGLDALDLDDIGMAGEGFEPDLWQEADPELVRTLLGSLPVAPENPPLHELGRRLLLTGGSLEGLEPGRLLEARAEGLLALGEVQRAHALLGQLPPSDVDARLNRLAAEAALWAGDHERACALGQAIGVTSEAAFWTKLVAFCRLRQGNLDEARLSLDLLHEAGEDDPVFFQLAEAMAGTGGEASLPALDEPSALHVAMLREAERPLPAGALDDPSPALVTAVARSPGLAPERALAFAEQAFLAGPLSVQELHARYDDVAPETPDDVLTRIEEAWAPETRAALWRQLQDLDEALVRERAQLLDAAWRASDGAERLLVARAFKTAFAGLPVAPEWLPMAPGVARALLAADEPVGAARWFSLLRQSGGFDPRAEEAAAVLAPLFAIAGVGGSDAVPAPDLAMLAAWRDSAGEPAPEPRLLYALLDGVGTAVPAEAWWALLDGVSRETAEVPATPVWRGLDRALQERRSGEVVLLALHMLGGEPEALHPAALIEGLAALRATGLDQETRAVALAIALKRGL